MKDMDNNPREDLEMLTSVQDAVATVVTAILDRRCLPFIGAGVSAWPEWSLGEQWDKLLQRITTDQARFAEVAAKRVMSAAKEFNLLTSEPLHGAPPGRFLEACLLSLLEPEKANRSNQCGYLLSTIAQHVYEKNPVALANLLYRFFLHAYPNDTLTPNSLHQKIALLPFATI